MSEAISNGARTCAARIIERVKAGMLTTDVEMLAKYIDTECAVPWLIAGCQQALELDAVCGQPEISIRAALAMAGVESH